MTGPGNDTASEGTDASGRLHLLDTERTASDEDQTASDEDQTASDEDQTASDEDQTASANEVSSAATDQHASDKDQAAADRDHAARQQPDGSAAATYEESRSQRQETTASRRATTLTRHVTSLQRCTIGRDRAETATRRDATAEARDDAAEQREQMAAVASQSLAAEAALLASHLEDLRHQAHADRSRAAADRKRAARDRAGAARDRLRLERQLHAAFRDDLTGILGTEAGLIVLSHELERARRADGRFVVAVVGVDDLPDITDREGSAAAERALQTVVDAIRSRLRVFDLLMRYHVDDLVAGLGSIDLPPAKVRFDSIRAALSEHAGIRITAGLVTLADGDTAPELIARADAVRLDLRARHSGASFLGRVP